MFFYDELNEYWNMEMVHTFITLIFVLVSLFRPLDNWQFINYLLIQIYFRILVFYGGLWMLFFCILCVLCIDIINRMGLSNQKYNHEDLFTELRLPTCLCFDLWEGCWISRKRILYCNESKRTLFYMNYWKLSFS